MKTVEKKLLKHFDKFLSRTHFLAKSRNSQLAQGIFSKKKNSLCLLLAEKLAIVDFQAWGNRKFDLNLNEKQFLKKTRNKKLFII